MIDFFPTRQLIGLTSATCQGSSFHDHCLETDTLTCMYIVISASRSLHGFKPFFLVGVGLGDGTDQPQCLGMASATKLNEADPDDVKSVFFSFLDSSMLVLRHAKSSQSFVQFQRGFVILGSILYCDLRRLCIFLLEPQGKRQQLFFRFLSRNFHPDSVITG